jgi:hypothetical protein
MKRPAPRPNFPSNRRGKIVSSADGVIAFTLAPTSHGLYVERVHLRPGAARVVQSTLFADDRSFQRWCDADAMRFDYPVVYVNLKRDGDALFASSP